jgi:hypothetical protein
MTPRKSQRLRKPRTICEKKEAPSAARDLKITKKAARTVEKTALKPIATGPLQKLLASTQLTFLSSLRTNHHLNYNFNHPFYLLKACQSSKYFNSSSRQLLLTE